MSLSLILTLVSSFLPLLQKYIGTPAETVVKTALQALAALIASWVSGSPAADLSASLAALQSVLLALAKVETNDMPTIAQIVELDKDVRAAIAAYEAAMVKTDPSQLEVPPPVA